MKTQDFIRIIAMALVDQPGAVSVNVIEGARTTVLELSVAKEDVGKVIGKKGRTVGAVRTILSSVAAKTRRHLALEIIE